MPAHLTVEDRDRIGQLVERGATQAEIATILGQSQATTSRELARNATRGEYLSGQAQEASVARRSQRPLAREMDHSEIQRIVRSALTSCWSPEQIAGCIRIALPEEPGLWVSAPTIYAWIAQQGEYREHWQKFVRRRGKQPGRKPAKPEDSRQATVSDQPQVIAVRARLGDLEGDMVPGPPGTGGIITVVNRQSRYTMTSKNGNKEAAHVREKLTKRRNEVDESQRHSITCCPAPNPIGISFA